MYPSFKSNPDDSKIVLGFALKQSNNDWKSFKEEITIVTAIKVEYINARKDIKDFVCV